ncbi:protein of unknown function [Candidatus Nitrospira inopinata]|uniref:Uncharacterized protein n=1 Tax=Candidatus Nitrospira inopinata TaxID=1715989 RepID=A0A0S4KXY7_9BACT|nr:protein of unknown function [Candidatus Nitrospira inopinata]
MLPDLKRLVPKFNSLAFERLS